MRPGKKQGQTIAFVGRSGRGKSTLFRALTGLEEPSGGTVLIPDYTRSPSNGIQPAKKVCEGDVGFVNQKYTLFRHKTVYKALQYALRNSKLSDAEKDEKIMHYIVDWGLEPCKNQYPNELSGGQPSTFLLMVLPVNFPFFTSFSGTVQPSFCDLISSFADSI